MRTVAGLVAGLAMIFPGTALAANSPSQQGVHVDPGSPAGKEYQIPVTSARNEGSGGNSGGGSAGSTAAPLFGAGIKPSGGSRVASSSSSVPAAAAPYGSVSSRQPSGPGKTVRHHRGARRGHPSTNAVPSSLPSGSASQTAAGGSGWIPLVIGGGLVLLLGGGGGLALRRRMSAA